MHECCVKFCVMFYNVYVFMLHVLLTQIQMKKKEKQMFLQACVWIFLHKESKCKYLDNNILLKQFYYIKRVAHSSEVYFVFRI